MTQNEIFDPVRSAAIRRMLVRTAARDAASPHERTKRIALITALSVVAVVLAGGSTAWALGVRPFPVAPAPVPTHTVIPSPTMTPTPTVAPTPVQHLGPPTVRIGVSCSDLAKNLTTLLPGAVLHKVNNASAENAALREGGYEFCLWSDKADGSVSVEISTDVVQGKADIASQKSEDGDKSANVGDESTQRCAPYQCIVSIVVGDYWATIIHQAEKPSAQDSFNSVKGFLKSTTAALRNAPPTGEPWTPPVTTWSAVTSCTALQTTPPMSSALNLPRLRGPKSEGRYGLVPTLPYYIACYWTTLPGGSSKDAYQVNVSLAAGAGWAFGNAAKHGQAVAVVGADSAATECGGSEDGTFCTLFVLSDNSFFELDLGDTHVPVATQKAKLIKAAEVILSTRGKR